MKVNDPNGPGMIMSPLVRLIMAEGDELSKRLAAMAAITQEEAFKAFNPLDVHLFTLQMDAMRTYLHILTIRIARANDEAHGRVGDSASALPGKKSIIKPN